MLRIYIVQFLLYYKYFFTEFIQILIEVVYIFFEMALEEL